MTTSRIVRGTKGRIFIYVCAILIVTGIIACYNNTRIELENAQKSNNLCHQQQENLSTQLQVISDYKLRLEKSLKTEKAEHQLAKTDFESRLNEEKSKHQKAAEESTLKFNSLQQHYNILLTRDEDLKEDCSKKQIQQLKTISDIQAKLTEVRGQLEQTETDKEKTFNHLRSQIQQLKLEKLNLEQKITELTSKKDELRLIQINEQAENNILPKPENGEVKVDSMTPSSPAKPRYSKQVSISSQEYKISNGNILPKPSNSGEPNASSKADTMLKVDNNQVQVVLQSPEKQGVISSKSPPVISSKGNLELAPPLKVPTMTPETLKNKTSSVKPPEPIASPSKSLPQGVVAMQMLQEDDKGPSSKGENDIVVNLVNNRYRNVANDVEKEGAIKENMLDAQERENGAHEVFDVGLNEDSNNVGGKHEEQGKNRIDEYDQFQQNEPNLDENEDDEADEYPHNHFPKEAAIRN